MHNNRCTHLSNDSGRILRFFSKTQCLFCKRDNYTVVEFCVSVFSYIVPYVMTEVYSFMSILRIVTAYLKSLLPPLLPLLEKDQVRLKDHNKTQENHDDATQ